MGRSAIRAWNGAHAIQSGVEIAVRAAVKVAPFEAGGAHREMYASWR